MGKPVHVSATWESIGELFVRVAEVGVAPGGGMPRLEGEEGEGVDALRVALGVGAVVAVVAVAGVIWRRAVGGVGGGVGAGG